MKRTRLERGTKRLERSEMPRRRTRLNPVSQVRAAARDVEAEVRAVVFRRDGRCLLDHMCGLVGPCWGKRRTYHHLVKGWKRPEYNADNGVQLCLGHNRWVEDDPPMARRLGLVVDVEGITHDEAARRRRAHGLVPTGRR